MPDDVKTLRVAICGAGMRSRRVWQRHLATREGFELAGVMDPAQAALDASVAEGHVDAGRCFTDLDAMLDAVAPDALLACPIIEAHGWAVRAGLESGCHVLVEKPFVTSVDEARELAELGESRERVLAVVQNWRTRSAGRALKEAVDAGRIGDVGHVVFRYLRDREKPHLPDYLFDEPDPVLWAMGIHHLDLFRYVLAGQEIVSVEGRAARPAWSRYRVPSINDLVLETDRGVLISYVASFSSRNAHIPQESLQVEGELGTLYNDSDYFEPPLLLSLRGSEEVVDLTAGVPPEQRGYQAQYDLADTAVLEDFRAAVLTGTPPIASARDNLGTLELVAACRDALRVSTVG
jgi:predicted dehydrogenase